MKPPKTVVERAKTNGSIDRASLLLSAAYLLNSEASNLVEEAGDILRANGLLLGELKKLQNAFTKAADRYFFDFASMIGESGKEKEYFTYLEDFDCSFRKWAKIDVESSEIDKHELRKRPHSPTLPRHVGESRGHRAQHRPSARKGTTRILRSRGRRTMIFVRNDEDAEKRTTAFQERTKKYANK